MLEMLLWALRLLMTPYTETVRDRGVEGLEGEVERGRRGEEGRINTESNAQLESLDV